MKQILKKLSIVTIAIAMAAAFLPGAGIKVFAAPENYFDADQAKISRDGRYHYMTEYLGNNVEFNGYTSSTSEITVPLSIDGRKVANIMLSKNCGNVIRLVVPQGYDGYIGINGVENASQIREIVIPKTIHIAKQNFFNNSQLTDVYFSGSKSEWNTFLKNNVNPYSNEKLFNARIHYNYGTSPATNPSPTKVKSAKNQKGKKVLVTWKRKASAKGYQVQYALNKKFTKKCKTKTLNKNTAKCTLKKLKKSRTYYIRIRSINGSRVSSWSKVIKVKIRK